jgi:hypothetical protein
MMFLLDWIGKNKDEAIINFSIAKAREQAWKLASILAYLPQPEMKTALNETDKIISALALVIRRPSGWLAQRTLKLISFFEDKDVKTIIRKLEGN